MLQKKQCVQIFLSAMYLSVIFFCVSFTCVYINDTMAYRPRDPPLRDLVLDNFGTISPAFLVSDVIIISLCVMFLAVLACRKERLQVYIRFNLIVGTLYLFRTFLVLATTLPETTARECKPFVDITQIEHLEGTWSYYMELTKKRFIFTWKIYFGFGMPLLHQIYSCGDYMFSGHTAVMTMLSFLIRKYTPLYSQPLKFVTWTLNIVGVVSILVAHEHYTVDVLVGFYIAVTLFNHHHAKCLLPEARQQSWIPGFKYLKDPFNCELTNECDSLKDLKNQLFLAIKFKVKPLTGEIMV